MSTKTKSNRLNKQKSKLFHIHKIVKRKAQIKKYYELMYGFDPTESVYESVYSVLQIPVEIEIRR